MIHRQSSALFSFIVISFSLCEPLFSQDEVRKDFTHYQVSHFTTEDGLPGNALVTLRQDLQGYLWLGGFEGLVRFDGTHFANFAPSTTSELKSSQISALQLDKKGTLWIGTGQGLVKYASGRFTNLATPDFTFYIESIAIDEQKQVLWLGTRNSGLYKYSIQDNLFTPIDNQFSKDIITCIALDHQGGIWVSSEKNGFAHYSNNTWKYYSKNDGLPSNEITWLHVAGEKLYVCTILGLSVFKDGIISRIPQLSESRITKVKTDLEGNIWVLTTSGIHISYANGVWQTLTKQNGLSVNDIRDVSFSEDGSVWLATYRGGLNQLKKEKFVTLSAYDGLAVEAISTINQLDENKFIAGTTDGKIFLIENRKTKPLIIRSQINKPICEILKDHLGNLWFATYDGLLLITPDGHEKLFTENDGLPTRQLRAIVQDKNKNYWIGSRTSGLIKMEFSIPGKPVFTKAFHEQLTQANATFVISMTTDLQGNLLVATSAGSIIKISPDGSLKKFNTRNTQSAEVAFAAHADANGSIWAASTSGLSRIKNDTVINFSRKEGIPHETVYDVVEDAFGYFWMPTARGIIKVKKSELEANIKNRSNPIHWRMYDKDDDLIKSECTGASRIFKDARGHLWFPMLEGLVTVNPEDVSADSKPPGIFIEGLTVDDAPVDIGKEIILPPGSKRFVISYHAISLKYQKAIRYHYKIENYDRDWIDPGNEVQAVYTSLPPGKHTFKVTACTKDEVCNSSGAVISFRVQPYFYQRIWFYFLCANAIVLAGLFYTRIRTRAIRQRSVELQQQVNLRTRELAAQRDELVVLNEELKSSQEEVMAQRDILSEKNQEIEKMNINLEKTVADRTLELEEQNKKLAEYAFINAHQLRAPLASILGIIHLFEIETDPESRKKLLSLLQASSNDLDVVIRSINKMLEEGNTRLQNLRDANRGDEEREV